MEKNKINANGSPDFLETLERLKRIIEHLLSLRDLIILNQVDLEDESLLDLFEYVDKTLKRKIKESAVIQAQKQTQESLKNIETAFSKNIMVPKLSNEAKRLGDLLSDKSSSHSQQEQTKAESETTQEEVAEVALPKRKRGRPKKEETLK